MGKAIRQDTALNLRSSEARSLFAQSANFTMYRLWTGQLRGARGGE